VKKANSKSMGTPYSVVEEEISQSSLSTAKAFYAMEKPLNFNYKMMSVQNNKPSLNFRVCNKFNY